MAEDSRYDGIIKAAIKATWPEMDWRLIKAQMKKESTFDPKAVSGCHACGLMQLMPKTFQDLGGKDIFNPVESVDAGVKYLKHLYGLFAMESGDEKIKFALAAYNAGEENIFEAQKLAEARKLDSRIWSDVAVVLPLITGAEDAHETTVYVQKIFEYWAQYKTEEEA